MKTRKVRISVDGVPKNRYMKAGSPYWWGYWRDSKGNPVWVIPYGIPAREPLDLEVEIPWNKRIIVGAGPKEYPGVRYTF
jgi:hypothetical protein